jgi:hypothetical protein
MIPHQKDTMRAFIFSLDAFVAFTLALVAIYSLIFFSSVPSSYYYLLTQGHYLTRDTLLSLSTTTCTSDYGLCSSDGSVLDNIVNQPDPDFQKNMIQNTIGDMIPDQFGYRLEVSTVNLTGHLGAWETLYDTAFEPGETHAVQSKKLSVSSQVVTFSYSGKVNKMEHSPYNYLTCGYGSDAWEDAQESGDDWNDWGIVTCGTIQINGSNGTEYVNLGNTHPSNIFGGDIVPSSDVKVVRFTVYI